MIEVALCEAEFFARHGYYAVEQRLGGRFLVDIKVSFEWDATKVDDNLANTLNYEQLFKIAEEEMNTPRKLLETVAQGIVYRIKSSYDYADKITVRVKKLNPPLKGAVKASAITITYQK